MSSFWQPYKLCHHSNMGSWKPKWSPSSLLYIVFNTEASVVEKTSSNIFSRFWSVSCFIDLISVWWLPGEWLYRALERNKRGRYNDEFYSPVHKSQTAHLPEYVWVLWDDLNYGSLCRQGTYHFMFSLVVRKPKVLSHHPILRGSEWRVGNMCLWLNEQMWCLPQGCTERQPEVECDDLF